MLLLLLCILQGSLPSSFRGDSPVSSSHLAIEVAQPSQAVIYHMRHSLTLDPSNEPSSLMQNFLVDSKNILVEGRNSSFLQEKRDCPPKSLQFA